MQRYDGRTFFLGVEYHELEIAVGRGRVEREREVGNPSLISLISVNSLVSIE